eukprot:scaffold26088_cov59-Phaeocystis_antarctica.AAC.2
MVGVRARAALLTLVGELLVRLVGVAHPRSSGREDGDNLPDTIWLGVDEASLEEDLKVAREPAREVARREPLPATVVDALRRSGVDALSPPDLREEVAALRGLHQLGLKRRALDRCQRCTHDGARLLLVASHLLEHGVAGEGGDELGWKEWRRAPLLVCLACPASLHCLLEHAACDPLAPSRHLQGRGKGICRLVPLAGLPHRDARGPRCRTCGVDLVPLLLGMLLQTLLDFELRRLEPIAFGRLTFAGPERLGRRGSATQFRGHCSQLAELVALLPDVPNPCLTLRLATACPRFARVDALSHLYRNKGHGCDARLGGAGREAFTMWIARSVSGSLVGGMVPARARGVQVKWPLQGVVCTISRRDLWDVGTGRAALRARVHVVVSLLADEQERLGEYAPQSGPELAAGGWVAVPGAGHVAGLAAGAACRRRLAPSLPD